MRKVEDNVIKITEEVKIGNGIILEKGDKIKVIEDRGIDFEGDYFSGTVYPSKKEMVIFFDDDDEEAQMLADHENDPVLSDIYDALEEIGESDVTVDESKQGIYNGDSVTLFIE